MKKLLGIVLLLALTSCGKQEVKPASDPLLAEHATFHWINENVLQTDCMKCHSATGHSSVKVDNYEALMNSKVVVAGDPTTSKFYATIVSGMMPKKAERLSDLKIGAVAEWIRNGALNN